ncbi:holo-ACP synthase [Alicyclobacillus tolerans]|uniref:holo-ACP synthase n=1 Tax=Alicyclobacillus tolerans TaxID=90970 RepID=UPI001F001046|nr:holo-ACP synthase [Alicyclobacillus tolerans]MCF8566371.1 holo-ACP synthase [Alicyclobacillus tolerans]
MIGGLGTDVVQIQRVATAIDRFGDRFAHRVLGPEEQRLYAGFSLSRRAEFAAGRFAAKEAIAKACGVGLGRLNMADVDILVANSGLAVQWHRQVPDFPWPDKRWLVSISHTSDAAFAVAVWEDIV